MSRKTLSATVATTIATLLATAATAPAAPPPKALTHQYPLGTETLCCQSHSATTPGTSSAPSAPNPATPHRQPAAGSRAHTSHHGRAWISILLGAIALAIVLVNWLVVRRSRRLVPRPRRRVPPALLFALRPIYRHHAARDAWILRAVGDRWGPVLRPTGDGARHPKPATRPADRAKPAGGAGRTPDPFDPATTRRSRTRRDDRAGDVRQEQEPPPLVIRRRPR